MEKQMDNITGNEMEEAIGSAGITGRQPTGRNDPRCTACGHLVQHVLSHFVCVNQKCSEFGKQKDQSQVRW